MYEVGSWFVYLIDAAVLALVGIAAMIFILYKRGKYQKEAVQCILCEIMLPSGWSEFHTIKCDINAKTVSINDFIYHINTQRRRFSLYPRSPLMGLKWLQVPIRTETWYQDNPEPMQQNYDHKEATAAEIKAVTREIQATTAAMQIQEIEARQNELVKAITNQPNKMIVYIGVGCAALFSLICLILVAQMAGISIGV